MGSASFSGSLVVFDLAGLVVNHVHAILGGVTAAFRVYGMSIDRDSAQEALGRSFEDGVRRVFGDAFPGGTLDEVTARNLSETYRKEVRRFFKFSPGLSPMPGFSSTLRQLREWNAKIGVCSDLDGDTLMLVLERLGWSAPDTFDIVVPADEASSKGCKAERLVNLMVLSGEKDGSRTWFMGTTLTDLAAGRQANCGKVFLLASGAMGVPEDWAPEADAVFSFADELIPYLRMEWDGMQSEIEED